MEPSFFDFFLFSLFSLRDMTVVFRKKTNDK